MGLAGIVPFGKALLAAQELCEKVQQNQHQPGSEALGSAGFMELTAALEEVWKTKQAPLAQRIASQQRVEQVAEPMRRAWSSSLAALRASFEKADTAVDTF